MTIKIGDSLPAGTLVESIGYDDGKNCPMPPQPVVELSVKVVPGAPDTSTVTVFRHRPGFSGSRRATL